MTQVFTQETLLRYVYNDLPTEARQEVEAALQQDPELAEECAELLLVTRALDGALLAPSARTTAAILAAARRGGGESGSE